MNGKEALHGIQHGAVEVVHKIQHAAEVTIDLVGKAGEIFVGAANDVINGKALHDRHDAPAAVPLQHRYTPEQLSEAGEHLFRKTLDEQIAKPNDNQQPPQQ